MPLPERASLRQWNQRINAVSRHSNKWKTVIGIWSFVRGLGQEKEIPQTLF